MRDPWAGHRNYFTGEPDGLLDEWTDWDFSLAMATQFIIDGTTEHGHLIWEISADDVDVVPVHDIDKAREAIELQTRGKDYEPQPGEFYRTKLFHPYFDKESGEKETWQTRHEWIEKLMKEEEGNL